MNKLIITVTISGGEYVSKMTTPNVPSTVDKIVEEVLRCVETGASIVYLHAKDPITGDSWSSDPNPVLKEYIDRIRERVNSVINLTTGGGRVGNPPEKRDKLVEARCMLGQEMMSLNMGTINRGMAYPTEKIFLNTINMIERWAEYMVKAGVKPEHEIYDTGMINIRREQVEKKIVPEPIHIQFVMVGCTGILPTPQALCYDLNQLQENLTWSV